MLQKTKPTGGETEFAGFVSGNITLTFLVSVPKRCPREPINVIVTENFRKGSYFSNIIREVLW